MRRALRVDANQKRIVAVLTQAGAHVDVIGLPVDLLVGYVAADGSKRLAFFEVKNGENRDTRKRRTEVQKKFFAKYPWAEGWPVCLVDSEESALRHLRVLQS